MIERCLANVFDLALLRPTRTGPSMDDVGAPTVLASGLCAIYEPEQRAFKDLDGREVTITARFFIDPCDNDGVAIDVRAHDRLQFTDFRGKLQKEQLILRVSPWYDGADVDHIEIEVG